MLALPADTRPAKYCRRAEASVRNNMPLKAPPHRPRLRDRQGPRGLLLLGQYFLNQTLLQSLRQNLAHQVG
jgi:hypothetical protein